MQLREQHPVLNRQLCEAGVTESVAEKLLVGTCQGVEGVDLALGRGSGGGAVQAHLLPAFPPWLPAQVSGGAAVNLAPVTSQTQGGEGGGEEWVLI